MRSAIASKRPILVVKHIDFQFPQPFPSQALDIKDNLLTAPVVIYDPIKVDESIAEIRRLVGPPDAVIKHVETNTALTSAILSGSKRLEIKSFGCTLENLIHAMRTYFRYSLDRLELLDIGCKLGANDFTYLNIHCVNLKSLRIRVDTVDIKDDQFQNISHCESVDLPNCKFLTNQTLLYIAKRSPNLERFQLGYSKITSEGIHVLATSCPKLKVINLQGNDFVDDQAVEYIATSCPLVQELILDSCEKITDNRVVI